MQRGLQRGLQRGIQGTVDAFRKFGLGKAEIKKVIMEQYGISADEAESYFLDRMETGAANRKE